MNMCNQKENPGYISSSLGYVEKRYPLSLSVASKAGQSRLEVQIRYPVNLPSGKLTTTSASSETKKTINNPIFRICRKPPEIKTSRLVQPTGYLTSQPTATLTFRFAAWIPHRPANRYAASPILSISLHRDVPPRRNKRQSTNARNTIRHRTPYDVGIYVQPRDPSQSTKYCTRKSQKVRALSHST